MDVSRMVSDEQIRTRMETAESDFPDAGRRARFRLRPDAAGRQDCRPSVHRKLFCRWLQPVRRPVLGRSTRTDRHGDAGARDERGRLAGYGDADIGTEEMDPAAAKSRIRVRRRSKRHIDGLLPAGKSTGETPVLFRVRLFGVFLAGLVLSLTERRSAPAILCHGSRLRPSCREQLMFLICSRVIRTAYRFGSSLHVSFVCL